MLSPSAHGSTETAQYRRPNLKTLGTLLSVSSPASVVRSVHVIARSSHAAWHQESATEGPGAGEPPRTPARAWPMGPPSPDRGPQPRPFSWLWGRARGQKVQEPHGFQAAAHSPGSPAPDATSSPTSAATGSYAGATELPGAESNNRYEEIPDQIRSTPGEASQYRAKD